MFLEFLEKKNCSICKTSDILNDTASPHRSEKTEKFEM